MKKIIIISLLVFGFSCINKKPKTISNYNFNIVQDKTINFNTFKVFTSMVKINSGSFIPLYGNKNIPIKVKDFYIDKYPVTNEEFLNFVKANPIWQKSKIKKLFADENYLNNWKNDTTIADFMNPKSPITNISWYAANAYANAIGKRLPNVNEWEYVAMANENLKDARISKSFNQYILNWYEKPNTYLKTIGSTFKNNWGVFDLHGLVWEWTSDFNSILITGESRGGGNDDKDAFCGNGSLNATDLMNYAAFMRYAFRSSLKAKYSIKNLGFRCAKNIK